MSENQMRFVLTAQSIASIQGFHGEKDAAIKIGNISVLISKELSILVSIVMYHNFKTLNDPCPVYTCQAVEAKEDVIVKCLKGFISLTEGTKTMELQEFEVPIMSIISKALRNQRIQKQIEAVQSSSGPITIQWTSELLSDFEFLCNSKEFSFDVCGEKFECPKVLAILLSRNALRQSIADASVSSLVLALPDGCDKREYIKAFRRIFELLSGHPLIIPCNKRGIFWNVASQIGCEELLSALGSFNWNLPPIDISNIYERMTNLRIGFANKEYSEVIEFTAKHLFELKDEGLLSMPPAIIERVLSSPQLRAESESQLFEFAKAFVENNRENAPIILSKIKFEFLEPKEVKEFISNVKLESISEEMWKAICKRLEKDVDAEESDADQQRWVSHKKSKIAAMKIDNQTLRRNVKELQAKVINLEKATDNMENEEILSATYHDLSISGYTLVSLKSKDVNGSVEIPDGIKKIDKEAFKDSKVTAVKLPSTLIEIGENAFQSCFLLSSIVLPSNVARIGESAFYSCSSLSTIKIPPNVTKISSWTFNGCSSLSSIALPLNLNQIGESAFYCCSALKLITIPPGVTQVGDSAFCSCSSLKSIIIPSGVTQIGDSVFCGCSDLLSITIPSGITQIGISAFCNCSALLSITIPPNVTQIGNWTFNGCSSLSSIEIPQNITQIGECAFNGCSSLSSINIPRSVTQIGDSAFCRCSSLSSIQIPPQVTQISECTFKDCSSLSSIVVPPNVTLIGNSAFKDCSSLSSITIPASVTRIGDSAFDGCSSLSSITIPLNCRISEGFISSFGHNTIVIRG